MNYLFRCEKCKLEFKKEYPMVSGPPERTGCPECDVVNPLGVSAKNIICAPMLILNHWKPDYRYCNDGQKEAQAAGIFE